MTTPTTMVSSSPTAPSSTDAIAVLAADRAYEGIVLGPAAPGNGTETSSMQQVTGQFVSPSVTANPQVTINASISSAPTPAINSGAGEGVGAVAVPSSAAVVAPSGALSAGLTNTTATDIAGSTTAARAAGVPQVGSGLVTAPAPMGSVVATPTLGTSPRLNVDNTAAIGRSPAVTTGDPSMATGLSGSNQSANGRVVSGTSARSGTAVLGTGANVSGAATTLAATNAPGTVVGSGTAAVEGLRSGTATTSTNATAAGRNLTVGARSGNATTPAAGTATGAVRVETASDGTVVMTNSTTRPSIIRRALRAIGIGRTPAPSTTGTTSTTTTTP